MSVTSTIAASFLRRAAAPHTRRGVVGVGGFASSASSSSSVSSSSQLFTVLRGFGSTAPSSSSIISEKEVRGLFSLWNDALATLDSSKVADRYSSKALLLPTVSDQPRNDYDSIKEYFDKFLQSQPQGEIVDSYVQIGECGTWAQDNGVYEFTLGATGDKVKGRYTFIYIVEDKEWKISHHHSSVMPEKIMADSQKYAAMEQIVKND